MSNQSRFRSSKEALVYQVFSTIASKYDYTNVLMSLGIHRHWQKRMVQTAGSVNGQVVLDLCCGTGQVTLDLGRKVGKEGMAIGVDFNEAMLEVATLRLEKCIYRNRIRLIRANANNLPFPENTFDCATIAYGLRNVDDPVRVLQEMKRVTKPGGRIVSLEITQPELPVIRELFELYLKFWIPFLGSLVTDNRSAYQYLHDSIKQFIHPAQLTGIMYNVGFEHITCQPLSLGIATIHSGRKPL